LLAILLEAIAILIVLIKIREPTSSQASADGQYEKGIS
jgi:hypothetical protein